MASLVCQSQPIVRQNLVAVVDHNQLVAHSLDHIGVVHSERQSPVVAVGFAIVFLLGRIEGGWSAVAGQLKPPVFFDWGTPLIR